MKGLQDVVNQAKALVQRLRDKETAVEATLKDVNTLSEQLSSMRQFREEAVVAVAIGKNHSHPQPPPAKLQPVPAVTENNSDGENQNQNQQQQSQQSQQQQNNNRKEKPVANQQDQLILAHQPIVLALLSENRRLAALEAENADLVKCLEEYQSALDMIMHKYRSHVTKFASANQILTATIADLGQRSQAERTETELRLLDRINDMAAVMRHACEMDDSYYTDVVCLVTRLHNENRCLRELLDSRITGNSANVKPVPPQPPAATLPNQTSISSTGKDALSSTTTQQPTVSQLLLNGILPSSFSSSSPTYQSVIYNNNRNLNTEPSSTSSSSSSSPSSNTNESSSFSSSNSTLINGLPQRATIGGASSNSFTRVSIPPPSSSYLSSSSTAQQQQQAPSCEFKLPRRPLSAGGFSGGHYSPPIRKPIANNNNNENEAPPLPYYPPPPTPPSPNAPGIEQAATVTEQEQRDEDAADSSDSVSTVSSVSTATSMATLCQEEEDLLDVDADAEEEGVEKSNKNNTDNGEVSNTSNKDNNEIDELVNEMMNMDVDSTVVEAASS